jgi:ABC-type branched-subunit amino acid transport system permease subunit
VVLGHTGGGFKLVSIRDRESRVASVGRSWQVHKCYVV